MRNKILFAFLIFSFNGLAQTNSSLDNKYGFKIFKFGTSPEIYKEQIQKLENWENNSNVSHYRYIGNDLDSIFNVGIDNLNLTFFKNKLMNIQITFRETFSKADYDLVLYSLKKLFGEGNECETNDKDFLPEVGRKWVGEKVEMELHRLYYLKNSKWSGFLSIGEINIEKERINDEF